MRASMVAPLYTRYVPPKPSSKPAANGSPSSAEDVKASKKRKHETKEKRPRKRNKADKSDPLESVEIFTTNGVSQGVITKQGEAENAPDTGKRVQWEKSGNIAQPNGKNKAPHGSAVEDHDRESHPVEGGKHSKGLLNDKKHEKREKRTKEADGETHQNAVGGDKSVDDRHKRILSKYEKSVKHSKEQPRSPTPEHQDTEDASELHDIVPLPVPEQDLEETLPATFSSLPSWQANPVIASSENQKTFGSLQVDPQLVEALSRNGFDRALPIQSAVLPLSLPVPDQHSGDLCVSATTGSGKTLAYAIPILQSLKARAIVKLRAVVVVPTRELVTQVRESFELCASGSSLKIGTAVGSHTFAKEQDALVEKGWRFDAEAFAKKQNDSSISHDTSVTDVQDDTLDERSNDEDDEDALPGHIREYNSQVDILICTPGRLVEHIKSTKGFTLRALRWLVIDEADRLLGESFQEWSTVLLDAIRVSRKDRLPEDLINHPIFTHFAPNTDLERVRKVLLSATMTRDLDKLSPLNLWNPRLVVLDQHEREEAKIDQNLRTEILQLPSTLEEFGIPIKDASRKPLYLVHLLRNIMPLQDPLYKRKRTRAQTTFLKTESSSSDTESDSLSSEDNSSVSSTDDDVTSGSERSINKDDEQFVTEDANVAASSRPKSTIGSQNALIFTSSNEATSRLSALLSHLEPTLSSSIATFTKSTSTSGRTLSRSIKSGSIRLLIATDRAARGLDLPDLGNVVNYDVPRSLPNYIHRVGRTARANKRGRAWTLVEDREGAWFWKDVAKGQKIDRGDRVIERVNIDASVFDDEINERYTQALKQLKEEVRA